MSYVRNAVVVLLALLFTGSALAQGKWAKLAPFPEPSEELLGASAGGKLYVFAGLAPGWKPKALVYEYDPATDMWAKKKPMALASHHVAFTEHKGKIYAFGGFVLPQSGPPAWVPIDNAFEYDPAADGWKALAPMPTKRGSPVAVSLGDKIFVIGGAVAGPGQSAVHPARPRTSVGRWRNTTRRRTPGAGARPCRRRAITPWAGRSTGRSTS
jgi:N-acetylneuraminic acid mutarotase